MNYSKEYFYNIFGLGLQEVLKKSTKSKIKFRMKLLEV